MENKINLKKYIDRQYYDIENKLNSPNIKHYIKQTKLIVKENIGNLKNLSEVLICLNKCQKDKYIEIDNLNNNLVNLVNNIKYDIRTKNYKKTGSHLEKMVTDISIILSTIKIKRSIHSTIIELLEQTPQIMKILGGSLDGIICLGTNLSIHIFPVYRINIDKILVVIKFIFANGERFDIFFSKDENEYYLNDKLIELTDIVDDIHNRSKIDKDVLMKYITWDE